MKILTFTIAILIFVTSAALAATAQTFRELHRDAPETFKLTPKHNVEFVLDLKAGELCNITSDLTPDVPITLGFFGPSNETLEKEGDPGEGYVFVADKPGRYRLVFKWIEESSDDVTSQFKDKDVTVKYSNTIDLPKDAVSKSVRNVNGYQAKILDEKDDEGKSYLVITKAGKTKALMRTAKGVIGGYYFADDASQTNSKKSAELFRTTADKTGDGTPDIAVEYFTGGAHCCFEITFFELGPSVHQLPTIFTDNDTLSAVAKLPGGGLRYVYADQTFAYWTINYAQSPMQSVLWEFRNEELSPRFDLMKKTAPTLAALRRRAAADKAKINLHPYTSPEDTFNDFEEPFWGYMLDLMYAGHEDLAWKYFDLVWPAKKPGKAKFLADFKEQLGHSTYGEWKSKQK